MTGVVVALYFLDVVLEGGEWVAGCSERVPDDKVIRAHAGGLNGISHSEGGHPDRSGCGIKGRAEPLGGVLAGC